MEKIVECALMDIKKIDAVSEWLTGKGDLIFSNEPDKVYRALFIKDINYAKAGAFGGRKKFTLSFDCQPFKYAVDTENHNLRFTFPATFYGKGTYKAAPVITVYGNGDINLIINDRELLLTDIDGYITINSDIMDAYKNTQSLNYKMVGEFPFLVPEENTISWTGNATKIKITPNWRWL